MLRKLLKSNTYLRAATVLAIDVITSVLASACVIWLFALVSVNSSFSGRVVTTWLVAAAFSSLAVFTITRTYRAIIRYSTLHDLAQLGDAVLGKEAVMAAAMAIFSLPQITTNAFWAMLAVDFFFTWGALLLVRIMMVVVYGMIVSHTNRNHDLKTVLVYGLSDKSASIVTRLRNSTHYDVAGFIVDEKVKCDNTLLGLPIYHFSSEKSLLTLKGRLALDGVLFAYIADAREEQDNLMDKCRAAGLKTFIAPTIDEIADGKLFARGIRNIKIEDLLGRSEIKISMNEVSDNFAGKTVMVTGAAGSIGSELCRQLAGLGIRKLIMFDNAETPLHNVRLEFEDKYPDLDFVPVIGDVRQLERLDYVFREYHPQIVFHAAAYKHVPLMEENPCEAVLVNVVGSQQVADKCVEYDAEKMVMVSTDKAVNPTNIMGCTKRLAEIYVQSLGLAIRKGLVKGKTKFITTRFGNVLGSNGSVIPRFTEQIAKGGPVTVTHPEIRRFFMTIPEACRLVMEAATMSNGNQILVFDMGTMMKISDLAAKMIHLAGYEVGKDIEIQYTGLRPGEKLYEEVLATKENTVPTDHERIFVAKVREYDHEQALTTVKSLEKLAREVSIRDMVLLMKRTVPEFKSKCSVYEELDKVISEEKA